MVVRLNSILTFIVVVTQILSCSSDDDFDAESGLSCSEFEACGGDPVGDWTVKELCTTGVEEAFAADTPVGCESMFGDFEITANGTLSLTEEGTNSVDISETIRTTITVDNACFQAVAEDPEATLTMAGCALVQAYLLGDTTSGVESASCDFVNDVCSCDAVFVQAVMSDGSYEIVDNTMVGADGEATLFCATSTELTTQLPADETGVQVTFLWQKSE